jgi:predicted RNase H-like HicB family nuclease
MSRETKLLDRMRANPRDVRPDDLFEVLRSEGVEVRAIGSGSHIGLYRAGVRMTMAVPHGGGHLKTAYVVAALKTFGLAQPGEVEEAVRRAHGRVAVTPAEDGGFIASAPEMPGCMTHGETRAEALANLDDAKACWLALGERG